MLTGRMDKISNEWISGKFLINVDLSRSLIGKSPFDEDEKSSRRTGVTQVDIERSSADFLIESQMIRIGILI
jgi:hypothetical protein